MHIVIIDDEAAVAGTLAESVKSQGHTVTVANSGLEGMSRIAAEAPDAVFLDLVMPGLSGLDLLREIRGLNPELPIVVVTGWVETHDLEEIRKFGVADIVEKPWALKQLDRALRSLGPGDRA